MIGVTGYLCSGKDTLAEQLIKKGFEHISLSDILRDELRKRKKHITRENLIKLGSELREFLGADILAEKAIAKTEEEKNYVISSIGTVGEINVLKKKATIVFVDAPEKKRFERMNQRKREQDPETFADFKKLENKESKGGGKAYREFDKCKKESNIIIMNNKSLEEFHKKIYKMLEDLKKKIKRPTWDEYFMEIAKTVSKRSTCDRGKTGCVIVKNKQILTTGYVGSAAGQQHCDEIGHLMELTKHADGITRKHCVRTIHAEQNAIVQAAKHGIAIKGATIYSKMEPCPVCARMIINVGIERVVSDKRYHSAQETRKMLKKAKIKTKVLNKETTKYVNQ